MNCNVRSSDSLAIEQSITSPLTGNLARIGIGRINLGVTLIILSTTGSQISFTSVLRFEQVVIFSYSNSSWGVLTSNFDFLFFPPTLSNKSITSRFQSSFFISLLSLLFPLRESFDFISFFSLLSLMVFMIFSIFALVSIPSSSHKLIKVDNFNDFVGADLVMSGIKSAIDFVSLTLVQSVTVLYSSIFEQLLPLRSLLHLFHFWQSSTISTNERLKSMLMDSLK